MYIEKKEEIIPFVINMETALKNEERFWYVEDEKYPSLQLWFVHMKFLQEIIFLFDKDQNWRNIEKVYEELEMESFYIQPKMKYAESKRELEDYIKRIKKALDIEG